MSSGFGVLTKQLEEALSFLALGRYLDFAMLSQGLYHPLGGLGPRSISATRHLILV